MGIERVEYAARQGAWLLRPCGLVPRGFHPGSLRRRILPYGLLHPPTLHPRRARAASLWSGVARCDVAAAAHLGCDDFGLLLAFQEQPQERQEH